MRLGSGGAHEFISQIRIYHGSTLIEEIANYGLLASKFIPLQSSLDELQNKQSILCGTNATLFGDMQEGTGSTATKNNEVTSLITGERLGRAADGSRFSTITAASGTSSREYNLNLLSLLGSLSNKYLTLFAMTSASLRVEIQLVSNGNRAINCSHAITSFTLNKVEYVAQFIELSQGAMSILEQRNVEWVAPSFRNFVYNQTLAASVQFTIPVPAKYSSLLSLYMTSRSKSAGDPTFHANSSNTFDFVSYTLRVGSNVIPSQPVDSRVLMFSELLKSIGSLSDVNHQCSINWTTFNQLSPVANVETAAKIMSTCNVSGFMIGQELSSYSGSDSSEIFQGLNTSTTDLFWNLQYGASTPAENIRFDTFAMFDCVYTCVNGMLSIQY
jgi:hypothetical protein